MTDLSYSSESGAHDDAGCFVDLWAYPLSWGATLSSHDWMPFYLNKFLNSDFVANCCANDRRGDIGTAVILWSESFKQDPAGTLPDNDVTLARLAGFGPDVDGWRAVRDGALYGWRACDVDGERFGSGGSDRRLGHPVIAEICHDMYRRKRGREQSRETANLNTLKSRVRTKLRDIKQARMAENAALVDGVAIWLRDGGHYCTEDNVRAALEALQGVPKVVGMHSSHY